MTVNISIILILTFPIRQCLVVSLTFHTLCVQEASQQRLKQLEVDKAEAAKAKAEANVIGNRGGKQRAKVGFSMNLSKKR